MAFALVRKSPRQHITDPNVFIERFPAEGSPLYAQGDLLEHLRRGSGESGKF
jgi:hypothetical protein